MAGIAAWALAFKACSGQWPTENSGPVEGAPGEVWGNINAALMSGGRGLQGGDSLAKLIAREFLARTRAVIPGLTEAVILCWADAHKATTGNWPKRNSGPVIDHPGESWAAVNAALSKGVGCLAARR
jgi:hypothetical protein